MLGVDVEKAKLLLIGAATLATAAAVSFNGLIGFVGLIAPHVVRLIWGGDHRFLLPMSRWWAPPFWCWPIWRPRTVASPGSCRWAWSRRSAARRFFCTSSGGRRGTGEQRRGRGLPGADGGTPGAGRGAGVITAAVRRVADYRAPPS